MKKKDPAKKPAENSGKTTVRGRPFRPGQSGNPGGRPKTAKFAEMVREFLEEKIGGKARLFKVLEDLQKHDPKILLYYAYGKPTETVEWHAPDATNSLDLLAISVAQAIAKTAK